MATDRGGGSGRGADPQVGIGVRGGAIRTSSGQVKVQPMTQTGWTSMRRPRGVMAPKVSVRKVSGRAKGRGASGAGVPRADWMSGKAGSSGRVAKTQAQTRRLEHLTGQGSTRGTPNRPLALPRVAIRTRQIKDTGGSKASTAASNRAQLSRPGGRVGNVRRGTNNTKPAARTSRSSSGGSSSNSRSSGLKNYGPGGNTPGGAIGRSHQSFFDIGNFLKNFGK